MLYLRVDILRKFGKAPVGRPFFDDLKAYANNFGRFEETLTEFFAISCCNERDANSEFIRKEQEIRERFPNACVSICSLSANEYDYYLDQEELFDDFMHRVLEGKVVKL